MPRLVAEIGRTAESRYHGGKFFQGQAAVKRVLQFGARFCRRTLDAGNKQQFAAEFHGDFMQARVGIFALEICNRFGDLKRITDRTSQDLIHIRDDGFGFGAGGVGNPDDG